MSLKLDVGEDGGGATPPNAPSSPISMKEGEVKKMFDHCGEDMPKISSVNALKNIVPFSFLDREVRRKVEDGLRLIWVKPGGTVIKSGRDRSEIYIVQSGTFVAVDTQGRVLTDALMGVGTYFGERAALFGATRSIEIRSSRGNTPSSCWEMQGSVLMDLLEQHNTRFALALSSNLRYKQGIYDQFLAFRSAVLSAIYGPENTVNFKDILFRYKALKPAIHTYVNDPDVLDTDAWSYAIRRLPANITTAYSIVLSRRVLNVLKVRDQEGLAEGVPLETTENLYEDKPSSCSHEDELEFVVSCLSPGKSVHTEERRRTSWEVMPGKLFILLREIRSDFLDIITNLCLHYIEQRKLRELMRPFGLVVPVIQTGLDKLKDKDSNKIALTRDVLRTIPRLTDANVDGLIKIWGEETLQRCLNVMIHHGDYSIFLDPSVNTYSVSADERWMHRVKQECENLLGTIEDFNDSDVIVDIISSNTHSVKNCVSPYLHENKETIMAWGRENCPDLFSFGELTNEIDRLYPVAYEFFKANPEERKKAEREDVRAGIISLPEREVTGVSVQLIDVNRLKLHGKPFDELFDPDLRIPMTKGRHLLLNIDYCFGSQGEHILRLLILTFGKMIRSINILGKAGGLCGKRGDILFPTHVLDEQSQGEMRAVDNADIDPSQLRLMSGRDVHVGPIITVEGTLLQNQELLRFYERLFHSTGMEMEASHYIRAIEMGIDLGILDGKELRTRFLYYVSDTPLEPSSSLAKKMSPLEGIPPLYSITRVLLKRVLRTPEGELKAREQWRHVARHVFRQTIPRLSHYQSSSFIA